MPRRLHLALPVLLTALTAGCNDGTRALAPGQPSDTTTTGAGEPLLVARVLPKGSGPQQTYWLRVDGNQRQPVSPATPATTDLSPGRHVIDLTLLPSWCRSVEQSQTIDVVAGQRVTLDFTVVCSGVVVTAPTHGPVVDLDGYHLTIDGAASTLTLASDAADTLPATPGAHVFSLEGVASYCSAAVPVSATIVDTATNRVTLEVTCRGSVLRLAVTTTGSDRDFDGYVVTVRDTLTGTSTHPVGTAATDVIGAFPEGTAVTVSLDGVAANCRAATASRTVTAGGGDTLAVAFDVACQPFPERGILLTGWSQVYRLLPSSNTLVLLGSGAQAEWSPDGSRIAYVDHDTLRVTAGDSVRTVAKRGANPAFSPDGRRLYFTFAAECGWDCTYPDGVYVLDLDVPGATSRVALTTGGGLSAFDIAPDGTGIAYVTCPPTGACALSYSRLDGSGKRTLLTRAGGRPRFSPDGGTILAYRWRDTDDSTGAWLVGTDGSGARLLRNFVSSGLAWSPDGSRVLLFRDYYDWSSSVSGDLLTVRASDGGDEQVLLRNVEAMHAASWAR